jgi:alpha-ribazole phosphatase
MQVYLIRHTTPDIPMGTVYGRTDLDVTRTFDEEVERIRSILPVEPGMPVYSSPLKRCMKLATRLNGDVEIQQDERLIEVNFGEWELKRWNDLGPASREQWLQDIENNTPPGGESFRQVRERIVDFWTELTHIQSDKALVISHGGVIRSLLTYLLEMPLRNAFRIYLGFGAVTAIQVTETRPKVMFINR